MFSTLVSFLLFACQVILSSSSVINENRSAVAGDAVTENRPVILPEGYTAFPEDNVAYKIYEIDSSWSEGRDRCIADGGHLAIPDSFEKVRHIDSLKTQNTKNKNKWLHVGIIKLNTNDEQWVRIDNNLPVPSVPWRPYSPNGGVNCCGVSAGAPGLVDYRCSTESEYFVCEIPL